MTDVTLHIIAKNEVETVQFIMTKYVQYFKEIHIAVDERFEDFKKLEKWNEKLRVFQ